MLGPDRPNEIINKAPGPIDDTEHVHVGIDHTGKPVAVAVDQQLLLHGVGDFDLKIPGPALDVSAPADAPNQPGLRRGSVVWAGFSGGTKNLTAHVVLNPDLEVFKLPLAITVTPASIRIENKTSIPVSVADGTAGRPAVAGAAAAVRAVLQGGGRPVAGTGGVPASLPATSDVRPASVPVMAPFHIVGTVRPPGQPAIAIDLLLPGPQAPDGTFTLPVSGPVQLTATPSPPDPASVDATVRSVEVALWETLRIDDVSAYLGNPFPGASTTTYTYETVAAAASGSTAPTIAHAVDHAKPFAIAMTLLAAFAVVALAGAVWARS